MISYTISHKAGWTDVVENADEVPLQVEYTYSGSNITPSRGGFKTKDIIPPKHRLFFLVNSLSVILKHKFTLK